VGGETSPALGSLRESRHVSSAYRPRKPRASSQSRIAGILAAARELLAEQGVDSLSIYSVAERAQIPPSSVHHFFASVPALLEALTADIHGAFRACLQAPIEHEQLRDWRDLSRLVEQRMLGICAADAAAHQLILAQQVWRKSLRRIVSTTSNWVRRCRRCLTATSRCRSARGFGCVRPGHGTGRSGVCALSAAARRNYPAHG
jgi:AcrR family transcriptional regulator